MREGNCGGVVLAVSVGYLLTALPTVIITQSNQSMSCETGCDFDSHTIFDALQRRSFSILIKAAPNLVRASIAGDLVPRYRLT